jgi:Myb-like DNA-binding domain
VPSSGSFPSDGSDREESGNEEWRGHDPDRGQGIGQDGDGNERDEGDNGTVSDSCDEDYANDSDAVGSEMEEQRRPRKLRRRDKDTDRFGNTTSSVSEEPLPTNGAVDSGPDVGAVSFCVAKESDAIFIHGFLPPKALESKIVFSFTISQDPLSQSSITACRHAGIHGSRGKPPTLATHAPGRLGGRLPFSSEEDELLVRLKEEEGLSWDEIARHFPGRTKGTLAVRYSTKLSSHPKGQRRGRKRQRSG